jgi:hypothetical protein
MKPKTASAQPTSLAPPSGAERVKQMRDWIAAAERGGAEKSELLLRLTHRDAATLKRHPSVQSEEISFADGGMLFLGVKVAEVAAADSALEIAAH